MIKLSPWVEKNVALWSSELFDENTRSEIEGLKNNPEELEDRFYKNLDFGTGGMRGVMGVGTNRINKYTLGRNTQGLSNYLKQSYPNQALKVAVAYDCRHNSKTFAKIVADVFSANGIEVFLFEDLRATPELSFAVKHLNCQGFEPCNFQCLFASTRHKNNEDGRKKCSKLLALSFSLLPTNRASL